MTVRESVSVVVVARRHPDRLQATLKSLATDGILERTVVVNLTGAELDASNSVSTIVADSSLSLSEAVSRGIDETTSDVVWILRDDTAPRPGAFDALSSILDTSPTAGIVGPKQLDADYPSEIREMGESISFTGLAVQLAERELDQGQYDRASDVLAVGEAGMLIRREIWEQLGGFDSSLSVVDGALDLCYRARTAGWRVEVVPGAAIDTVDTSIESQLGTVSVGRVHREESRARAFRLLVTNSAIAAPFIAFALVVGAIGRGIGRALGKRNSPLAELAGVVAALTGPGSISRSRKLRASIATQPINGSKLFVSRAEMARRRAVERDAERATREELDNSPRLGFGHLGIWTTVAAGIAGAVFAQHYFGAQAVSGGAILPIGTSIGDVWRAVGSTWTPAAGGITTAPDGFAVVVAVLGSLAWWNPNVAVVALWILAVPLAFVAAWFAVGAFHTSTVGAAVTSTAWVLLPSLHIALAEGRLGAVLAHIFIPLAVRALFTRGIVGAAWFSLLAAALWASIPALAPLIVIVVIARSVTGRPRFVVALLPALAIEWPRMLEALAGTPLNYFADRGVPLVAQPHGSSALGLWPQNPVVPFLNESVSAYLLWGLVAVVVAATLWVVLAGDNRLGVLTALGSLGVIWATVLSQLSFARVDGIGVGVFNGPLLDVMWLAGLIGLGEGISRLPSFARLLSVPAIATALAVSASAIAAPLLGTTPAAPSLARTVPAYVEAETNNNPGAGTLVISLRDGTVVAEVRRDSGTTLSDWTASAATRTAVGPNEPAIATLAGNLVVESGFDVVAAANALNLSFILLDAEESNPAVSSISSHPGLAQVGVTDQGVLWTVMGSESPASPPNGRNVAYLVVAGLVGLVAVVAAIPTSLPRRRRIDDDLAMTTGDDNG